VRPFLGARETTLKKAENPKAKQLPSIKSQKPKISHRSSLLPTINALCIFDVFLLNFTAFVWLLAFGHWFS
jgi:hypothetical protein